MKHLSTYLLLKLGGNDSPTAEDVKEALSKVGVEVDDDRLSKMLEELDGKDLGEIMEKGKEQLASFGGGGGGGGSGGGGAGGDAGGAAAEEEKEEEEEEEEADLGGGMDMFGGDDGGDY